MLALYIIGGVVLVLVILSLIKINAHFTLAFENKLEGLELEIQYLFFKKVIFPKTAQEDTAVSENEEKPKKNGKLSIELMYYVARRLKGDILKVLKFLTLKTVKVEKFNLETRIGTNDHMYTGIAIGAANGFVYNSLALLDRHKLLKSFSVAIDPDWNNEIVKGGLYVKVYTNIFTLLRLAGIVLWVMLKALRLMKEFEKGKSDE